MIKLDYDAVATYQGGIAGLPATSPSVTGRSLTGGSTPERQYTSYVDAREKGVVSALRKAVPSARVHSSHRVVYRGIAASVPANAVKTVLGIDGVVAVQEDKLRKPLTDSSPQFVNAPPVYSRLGTTANAGEGVIYGNLDTGVWPEHPSFADLGNLAAPPGPARECDFGDNPLTPASDPFVCQNKLIGGAAFLDTYLSDPARAAAEPFHTARDSNGHGTHTSSTSAGNIVPDVLDPGLTEAADPRPGARCMGHGEYKVCGLEGCFSSDSARAVAQAILDGVDVINFSISGGEQPFTDPVELAFLDAYAANVFVSASAGNAGPGAGTANDLSPWVTTVAASTQTREFATTLTIEAAGDTFQADGASITPGAGPLPVVLASDAPYSDPHWLPTVHLADGTDFLAFMNSHTDEIASFPAGESRNGQGDAMAAFSSRGPRGLFIKPDVTAPGVQILAGDTPIVESPVSGPGGELFQAIAGTSMSSPHVAGAGLLLRAVHPDWTPGQIRSALMTTAVTNVVKEDTVTPADPFDLGAGRIDLGKSAHASLTMDEATDRFLALGNDPVHAVHLNIPSINAPVMPGRLTRRVWSRTRAAEPKRSWRPRRRPSARRSGSSHAISNSAPEHPGP